MEWTNELIFLAPLLLPDRKLIEDPDFVDVYTKVEGEVSEYELYLFFKFTSQKKYEYLNYYMKKLPYYWNTRFFNRGILFVFKRPDPPRWAEPDFYNFKSAKDGNVTYSMDDWAKVFTFWGDRLKEMPRFWEERIWKFYNEMKKGLQQQPFCLFKLF